LNELHDVTKQLETTTEIYLANKMLVLSHSVSIGINKPMTRMYLTIGQIAKNKVERVHAEELQYVSL